MAATLLLYKITHRSASRIRIDFPYDPELIARVKALPNRQWSQTKKCWHVPDTAENLRLLQALGGTLVETPSEEPVNTEPNVTKQPKPKPTPPPLPPKPRPSAELPVAGQISVYAREGRLRLTFQYDIVIITFVKTLPYPVYNKANRWWSVPSMECPIRR